MHRYPCNDVSLILVSPLSACRTRVHERLKQEVYMITTYPSRFCFFRMPDQVRPFLRRWPGRCMLLAVLLLQPSCSGHDSVNPVTGKVLYRGRPATGAVVQLHPQDSSRKSPPVPQGIVGTDGSFQLTTYAQDDGAPAGRYSVSIYWIERGKGRRRRLQGISAWTLHEPIDLRIDR